MDMTVEEAMGMMKRVCRDLLDRPVRWVSSGGDVVQFHISASIGVAQCDGPRLIGLAFERADRASYASKSAGKACVTGYSETEDQKDLRDV